METYDDTPEFALYDALPDLARMPARERKATFRKFMAWHASDCPDAPWGEAARLFRVKFEAIP